MNGQGKERDEISRDFVGETAREIPHVYSFRSIRVIPVLNQAGMPK